MLPIGNHGKKWHMLRSIPPAPCVRSAGNSSLHMLANAAHSKTLQPCTSHSPAPRVRATGHYSHNMFQNVSQFQKLQTCAFNSLCPTCAPQDITHKICYSLATTVRHGRCSVPFPRPHVCAPQEITHTICYQMQASVRNCKRARSTPPAPCVRSTTNDSTNMLPNGSHSKTL